MKNLPKRKQARLTNYDYFSQGFYFVTICIQNRTCLFGSVVKGKMVLDDIGKMVNRWWFKIPKRFKNTQLDVFQIMPNHLRGIIRIVDNKQSAVEAGFMPARNQRATTRVSPTIGDIVGAFKSLTTDELHSSG